MSITRFFAKQLNAPLANGRWSWGAQCPSGGIYLRVWADEFKSMDGKRWARLTRQSAFADRSSHPGWAERKRHVAVVAGGAKAYAVVCRAKDPKAATRQIASFKRDAVLVGGTVRVDSHGDHWLEIVGRKAV